MWDRRTLVESAARPVGILAGHVDGLTYVDSRGDGRHLITNSKDQSIKLWDMRKFSGSDAQESTYQVVRNHNWDYRWQNVPWRCEAFFFFHFSILTPTIYHSFGVLEDYFELPDLGTEFFLSYSIFCWGNLKWF